MLSVCSKLSNKYVLLRNASLCAKMKQQKYFEFHFVMLISLGNKMSDERIHFYRKYAKRT